MKASKAEGVRVLLVVGGVITRGEAGQSMNQPRTREEGQMPTTPTTTTDM
jgi:hypothetical protein